MLKGTTTVVHFPFPTQLCQLPLEFHVLLVTSLNHLYLFKYSFSWLSIALDFTLFWLDLSLFVLFVAIEIQLLKPRKVNVFKQFVAWLEWLTINHHRWQFVLWYSPQGLTKPTATKPSNNTTLSVWQNKKEKSGERIGKSFFFGSGCISPGFILPLLNMPEWSMSLQIFIRPCVLVYDTLCH